MSRKYYILYYCLDGSDSHLIWHSNEEDGVFVDEDGRVPSFRDRGSLLKYTKRRGISIEAEEPVLHNLDELAGWLNSGGDHLIGCDHLNAAWNLFADVSRSIESDFDTDQKLTQEIYNKLFWGCNLPSVTPAGERYYPLWTKRELRIMRKVLSSGLQMFRDSMRSR